MPDAAPSRNWVQAPIPPPASWRNDHPMKLICGIDTTKPDPAPAEFATVLGRDLGAELTLAHFVPAAAAFPRGNGTSAQAMHSAVTRAMGEQVGDSVALGRGDATGLVESGDPAEGLVALADEEPDSMIVVGSRRRGAASATLLGSVSREIVLRAGCPVIVVPGRTDEAEPAGDEEIETIVIGYDGGEEALVALRCAAAIADRLGARLVVAQAPVPEVGYLPGVGTASLNVALAKSGPPRGLDAIERLPWDVPVDFVRVDGPPEQAIAELAARAHAGLIAVGSRGRGPLGELLLGSTSATLARTVARPVMICTREAAVPVA